LFKIKKSSFGSQALGLNFKSHDPQWRKRRNKATSLQCA
jgi:hypothetical protein